MAAITICSDYGANPQNKVSHCLHCFPLYNPCSNGTRCHDLSFLNVELEANFFTLLLHFHPECVNLCLMILWDWQRWNEPWWERTHRNGLLWGPDILGLGSNFELLQMFDGIEMGVGAGVLVWKQPLWLPCWLCIYCQTNGWGSHLSPFLPSGLLWGTSVY